MNLLRISEKFMNFMHFSKKFLKKSYRFGRISKGITEVNPKEIPGEFSIFFKKTLNEFLVVSLEFFLKEFP